MEIRNHKLDGVPYLPSPNVGGPLVKPTILLIHYTAGRSAEQSINTLRNAKPAGGPSRRVSAHLVGAREGGLTQLVPFNRQAWHAGPSVWNGRPRCNTYSIGLELDNFGFLRKGLDGQWRTWWGQIVPPEDVIVAKHKNGGKELGWHTFGQKQIADIYLACEALVDAYPTLTEVAGHDDVAPGRKKDPGPAFPMDEFRAWLFDRGQA